MRAIRAVLQGDTWFSRAIADKMKRLGISEPPAPASPALTEREIQVLQLMVEGKTDRQIGQALAVSERTVRQHLQSIYLKLAAKTRVEAAVRAVQLGLVEKE